MSFLDFGVLQEGMPIPATLLKQMGKLRHHRALQGLGDRDGGTLV